MVSCLRFSAFCSCQEDGRGSLSDESTHTGDPVKLTESEIRGEWSVLRPVVLVQPPKRTFDAKVVATNVVGKGRRVTAAPT